MTDDPDGDLDEAFDVAADAAWEWWCQPTNVHLFHLGAACNVPGFAPRFVLDAACKHLGERITAGELQPPRNPFALVDLATELYAED
jgi:hypothetical protein